MIQIEIKSEECSVLSLVQKLFPYVIFKEPLECSMQSFTVNRKKTNRPCVTWTSSGIFDSKVSQILA